MLERRNGEMIELKRTEEQISSICAWQVIPGESKINSGPFFSNRKINVQIVRLA